MTPSFEYEPDLRKKWLIDLLRPLADPNLALNTLKNVVQSEAVPYVWRWQDDMRTEEGDVIEVRKYLTDASENLISLLYVIVDRYGLPKIGEPCDSSTSKDSSQSESNSDAISTKNSDSRPSNKSRNWGDQNLPLTPSFHRLSEEDAEFCTAALGFLFYAADGSGGAKVVYVGFTELRRIACSLLYVINLDVSLAAARLLGQAIGHSSYLPPQPIPRLLLSLAFNVPCKNGSSPKADKLSLSKFVVEGSGVEEMLQIVNRGNQDKSMEIEQYFDGSRVIDASLPAVSALRLKLGCKDRRCREMLVAQQAYAIATLIVLLKEHGFEKFVAVRAPNALPALLDLCRDTDEHAVSSTLKASIVESVTIFLSFFSRSQVSRYFRRLQLTSLLDDFYRTDIEEIYFYQICDLASFSPTRVLSNPIRMIDLSVDPRLSSEAKLRTLDVLARVFDPPLYEEFVVPENLLETAYSKLYDAFEHDLNEVSKINLMWTRDKSLRKSPYDPNRYFQLLTERIELLFLFIKPLSWTNIERIVFKSNLLSHLTVLLQSPSLYETLPARAVMVAADTVVSICREQDREHILYEQGLYEKLYDIIILLARAKNRPYEIMPAIRALYIFLWDPNMLRLFETIHEEEGDSSSTSSYEGSIVSDTGMGEETVVEPSPVESRDHRHHDEGTHIHSHDHLDDDSNLTDLQRTEAQMAAEVISENFIKNLGKLVRGSTSEAAEALSVLFGVFSFMKSNKVDPTPWVYNLVSAYLYLLESADGTNFAAIQTRDLFKETIMLDSLGTPVGELWLKHLVFSQDKLSYDPESPFGRPYYLDDILRSVTEWAVEGEAKYLIRLIHYASMLGIDGSEDEMEEWYVTELIPVNCFVDIILDYLKRISFLTPEDLRLVSLAVSSFPQDILFDIFKGSIELVKHFDFDSPDPSEDPRESLVTFLDCVLAALLEGPVDLTMRENILSRLIDLLMFALEDPQKASTSKAIRSLINVVHPSAYELGFSAFSKLHEFLKSKMGYVDAVKYGFLTTDEKAELLVEEWNTNKWESVSQVLESSVQSTIVHMSQEYLIENRETFYAILRESFKNGTVDDNDERADDRDAWLDLASSLVARLASVPQLESDNSFYRFLVQKAHRIMELVADEALVIPQAFSALHSVLLNILAVEAMIELRSNKALRDEDGALIDAPRSCTGIVRDLPPKDVLQKFIVASMNTLAWFKDDYSSDLSQERAYQLGILGLSFSVAMVAQSHIDLASTVIESGFVSTFVSCQRKFSPSLRAVSTESLLGLCHVLLTSPAVLAGILIAKLDCEETRTLSQSLDSIDDAIEKVTPVQAILLRRPELRKTAYDYLWADSKGNLYPWSRVEALARAKRVNVEKPESLSWWQYPSLPKETAKTLVQQLTETFLQASEPCEIELVGKILLDLLGTSGKTRRLIYAVDNKFVEKTVLKYGTRKLPEDGSESDMALINSLHPLVPRLIAGLAEKSLDEPSNQRTRKILEKAAKHIARTLVKVLEDEVPRRLKENAEEAAGLLHTCIDIVLQLWGDSPKILSEIRFFDGISNEKLSGRELFYQAVIKDAKLIESLAATLSLINLDGDNMRQLSPSFLLLFDRLAFLEVFTVSRTAASNSSNVSSSPSDSEDFESVSSDSELDSVDVEDYDSEEDDGQDLMEADLAEERRQQHRQRIEASRGNTFRNSSLGDYESSSESSGGEFGDDDDEGNDEGIMELGTHIGSFFDSDSLVGARDDGDDHSGGHHYVLTVSPHGEDSMYDDDEGSDGEQGSESDDGSSGESEQHFEIILDETDTEGSDSDVSIEIEETTGSQAMPAFELDDEVLLLYNERQDELSSLSSDNVALNNYFTPPGTLHNVPEIPHGLSLPIEENSPIVWDWISAPADQELAIRNTEFFEKNARDRAASRASRVAHLLDSSQPFSTLTFVVSKDASTTDFTPVYSAIIRMLFAEGFDVDNEVLQHAIIAIVGSASGQSFFVKLFRVLYEVASGGIDNAYASATRAAASSVSYPLPNSELSSSVPPTTTPAMVCYNILVILNLVYGADLIVESPDFLWNKANSELCEYPDCESDFLNAIYAYAIAMMQSEGTTVMKLITLPVISENKNLLELTSALIQKIAAATKDKWDPTMPGNASDAETSSESESDSEDEDEEERNSLKWKLDLDETVATKIIDVLGSREYNYRAFRNIIGVIKKYTSTDVFSDPLVKELRKVRSELVANFRKAFESAQAATPAESGASEFHGKYILFQHQLKFLRLLNVVGSLFTGAKSLDIFQKVEFTSLWSKVAKMIDVVQQAQTLLPEFMLSLLELIMMPAEIIYREYDDIANAEEKQKFETFINEITNVLQAYATKYRNVINELIRVKHNLVNGPLGSVALRFKVIDFKNKCDWLSQEIWHYREHKYAAERETCVIDRDNVFEDSFEILSKMEGEELLYPMRIEFKNEPGTDEGGVSREWYEILSREILNPMYGLFKPTFAGSSIYQIDPLAEGNPDKEEIFRFVGRVIGRAVYDQFTVGLYFSRVIYKYFLNESISLSDMEAVDESYYKSLRWMLDNDITDVFFETFSVDVENFGVKETVDLIPDGRNIAVDESNKHEYVKLIVEYRLVNSVKSALDAMKRGLYDVLLEPWVQTFTDQELELLISGLPTIDVNDWYQNTEYVGFSRSSPQVRWFWSVVRSFNPEMQAKLLQFSTGTSRVPAHGFGHLESNTDSGKFIIFKEKGSTSRLPSAHTCMNQINLPEYESYGKLRRLLIKAITEGYEGFGFV